VSRRGSERKTAGIRASVREIHLGVRHQGRSRTAVTVVTYVHDNREICVIAATYVTTTDSCTATLTSTPDIEASVEVSLL